MPIYSNFELNSFLTDLMIGWDEQAAIAVVETFHDLPLAGGRTVAVRKMRHGASVTGCTDEAGDVTIPDRGVEETIKGEREEEVARVGHYKVKRMAINDGQSFAIIWRHFWESSITTMSHDKAPPSEFAVEYVKEELKPIALIRWDFVEAKVIHLSWRDWMIYLKAFAQSVFLMGRIPEMHIQSWTGRPTVLFGKSKFKAAQ